MQDSQSDGGDHDAHRIPARDLQAPPPAKVQKVGRKGKTRMRKGDLKRQRKAEALSQAEVNCHYYLDSNGAFYYCVGQVYSYYNFYSFKPNSAIVLVCPFMC